MKRVNSIHENPERREDTVEALLRDARPEPAAPLSEDRAQEIFARALALSGAARPTPQPQTESAPWWRRLALPAPTPAALWGGGVATAAVCSLAAVLLLGGGKDRVGGSEVVGGGRPAPAVATVADAGTARTGPGAAATPTAPDRSSPAAGGGPVLATVRAPEARASESRPPLRERRPAPAGIRPVRPATMLARGRAAKSSRDRDDAPRLLIVASGGSADDRSTDPDESADDPFVIDGGAERLFVAVAEGVPADRPGRAEAGALREVTQVGPAGPVGIPGGEGPALPPAMGEPRTTVVWAQASVATDEEPTLTLTEMPAGEDPESAPDEEDPQEEEAPVLP